MAIVNPFSLNSARKAAKAAHSWPKLWRSHRVAGSVKIGVLVDTVWNHAIVTAVFSFSGVRGENLNFAIRTRTFGRTMNRFPKASVLAVHVDFDHDAVRLGEFFRIKGLTTIDSENYATPA